MASVGFIGIGSMGLPMAANVLKGGHELTVFNRTASKCDPLEREGATVAGSPAEVAAATDIVITTLADGDAAEAVFAGEDGLRAGNERREREGNLIWVEMSTIGPVRARELAARVADAGIDWLDAPVSGSVTVAEAAQLSVMAGGEEKTFAKARPVLKTMSKSQTLLGPAGAGAAMKLAVNLLVASTAHAVSEALVLAEHSGIGREQAYDVIANSALASPFIDYKRAAFLDPEGEPPAFALDLMRKDLRLATELGESHGIPMLSAAASDEAMALAAGLLGGDRDLVAVADGLRETAATGEPTRTTDS